MELKLSHLRQIALPSSNLSKSVQFYRDSLGADFIAAYEPSGLAFFRLGGTRLLLEHSQTTKPSGAVLYFEVPDIDLAYAALLARGVEFDSAPHLIHRDETGTFGPVGGEEWMAFFKDPDGNVLALASRIAANAA
jgi:catechol 2,3-dioxygenase-like lactoylglutathione lyase family enzyme